MRLTDHPDPDNPIAERVTRYRCPHCRRSYAHRGTATKHIERCFVNPAVRGCLTCKYRDRDEGGDYTEDICLLGVDLRVDRCSKCGHEVEPDNCTCPALGPMSKPVRAIRVQCDVWEAS